jgi:hypothetical protein
MSTQASTRQSPFYLMHGWHPKVPLNTVEISRMTQDQVAEWEREHKETTTAVDNLRYLSSSGDLTSSSGDLGLNQRQGQIELAEKTRAQAEANIQAAQKRQATDYNRRRGIPETAQVAKPSSLFKPGDYILIRELNPNNVLKPGEKAGSSKLRGTVRGPFRYGATSPTSKRYCTVEDAAGNIWNKAYHDVIPYDNSQAVSAYKVSGFPLPTREAIAAERSWAEPAAKGLATPTARSRKKKRYPAGDDDEYDGLP